jgi:inner membrane protein involved in colicin E2 resistance
MELSEMSRKEQKRHEVLKRLLAGKLLQQAAAMWLTRHVDWYTAHATQQ